MEAMILICDDDATVHAGTKQALKGKHEFRSAYNGDEALAIIRKEKVDLVLLDVQMRTSDEGLKYIPKLLEADPELIILMMSSVTEFDTVREAMRRGAADYVSKAAPPEELLHAISRALERRTLLARRDQQNYEAATVQRGHVLLGESPIVRMLQKAIDKIRPSGANVLITGETGTGKEVVARLLRKFLPDGTLEPFVAVDSATIQSSTAESQLFGHEKGAFTGADRASKGIFEEANGGVVYFDEIANMPLSIQAKLLRVLQEKEIVRLGSARVLKLEFRVIAATNRDLYEMVNRGEFKDDLLQRLSVLPVSVPPLRDRTEDLPLLIEHFLRRHSMDNGRRLAFSAEAIEVLKRYPWPGNVRELANTVSYLVTMSEGDEIDVADLPPRIRDLSRPPLADRADKDAGDSGFYEQIARLEREILTREYENGGGNISKVALKLRMDRSHLYTKLKEHGIHAPKRPK